MVACRIPNKDNDGKEKRIYISEEKDVISFLSVSTPALAA